MTRRLLSILDLEKGHRAYPDSKLGEALHAIIANGVIIRFLNSGESGYLEFAFLGFTEKTIKSGHVILLQKPVIGSKERIPSVDFLLQSFGNLQDVFKKSGPGKYVARLGLSFSATVESVNPAPFQVARIPDLEAGNGVLTTDGCGIIRESYAKEIRSKHSIASGTCVFQIRRGGIKGLLVAYPDDKFDDICRRNRLSTPDKFKIAYRPSMFKYDGGPTHIEINGISKPSGSSKLSRSVVVILISLGAIYGGFGRLLRAFKELLKLHLRSVSRIAYDRNEALDFIQGELDAEGDSHFQELYEMLLAGHSLDDAYIQKRLRDCQRVQYKDALKKKLRIRVQKSCYVYGVVDELGVLAEDEVYIQLPNREGVLVSTVLVARYPAYKPSDVRVMKAVGKSELDFLTNCIVFPRTGQHSIPGSMSGGDLDGDKYFVCWEPTILPRKTQWPAHPTVQPATARIDWSKRNLNNALVYLFVEQHHNKILGMASMEWQSIVECYFRMAGAIYPKELAGIVEEALDILKNGSSYAALRARYYGILREYDVERDHIKQRRSKLHIITKLIPSINEDRVLQYDVDQDLILQDEAEDHWWECYEQGERVIDHFNKGLREAIARDEADKSDGITRRRAEDGPTYVEGHRARFIDQYFPRTDTSILSETNRMSYIRASAWYCLGYDRNKPAFAWLGIRFLNNIKSYKTNGGRPGLTVGALKRLEDTESQLEDQYRGLWLYSGLNETQYPAQRSFSRVLRISRIKLGSA